MIKVNNEIVKIDHFPDGTLLIKPEFRLAHDEQMIEWHFENNEELTALYFLTKHLQTQGKHDIHLYMPYIPNARQDRVKSESDVFTLKYFCEMINSLNFTMVRVLDPHSSVSEALLNNLCVMPPAYQIQRVISRITKVTKEGNIVPILFYPDEGAMKRYSAMISSPYMFGIKKRNWEDGKIIGLDVIGDQDVTKAPILIVDDICSKGGTFYFSAKKLKEIGAKDIYLYVSHCENSILDGDLINSGLLKRIYTTDSIFTKEHELIEVCKL